MKRLLMLLLVSSLFVNAHLASGEDKVVGDYFIDFGHEPGRLVQGEKTVLAFNLANASTLDLIEPSSVWIRISKENDVVFAGTFEPLKENITFSYTFPSSGNYEITAKFSEENKVLVQTNFQVNVMPQQDGNLINYFAIFLTGGLIGILLVFLIDKVTKK